MAKRGKPVIWRVITYRLPAEPSRHRVAVWRELRRLGAVPLQQGAWAVPEGDPFGVPSPGTADQRLKDCADALESFAEKVYEARERP